MIRLTRDEIDDGELTRAVRRSHCGAVVTFLGTVRDVTGDAVTVALEYEAYPGMAEKILAEIEADVRGRWPVGEIAIEHRLGRLDIGATAVAIAVSCPHRAEAFEACKYAMDQVKRLAPIWKKENWVDGRTEWVHPGAPADGVK
ncbi:MAG: molybdenum cofactor biosynthesis protein MoaE [Planctomycetota bacterium]|jgi:molybdopterin synthase catalytic subunit